MNFPNYGVGGYDPSRTYLNQSLHGVDPMLAEFLDPADLVAGPGTPLYMSLDGSEETSNFDDVEISTYDPSQLRFEALSSAIRQIKENPDKTLEDLDLLSRVFFTHENGYSVSIARDFGKLNRYPDIFPYNHLMVSKEDADYVNASPITLGEQRYIATDAPVVPAMNNYWNMLWNENVKSIVNLTDFVENRRIKAVCYWPMEEGDVSNFFEGSPDEIAVVCKSIQHFPWDCDATAFDKERKQYFTVYSLEMTKGGETKEISILHYRHLPDMGAPETEEDAEIFRKLLDSVPANTQDNPLVVHCSAGVGRSGMFIGSHYRLTNPSCIETPAEVVVKLRSQRIGCVQRPQQYEFMKKFWA